jgi:hypothetical protein
LAGRPTGRIVKVFSEFDSDKPLLRPIAPIPGITATADFQLTIIAAESHGTAATTVMLETPIEKLNNNAKLIRVPFFWPLEMTRVPFCLSGAGGLAR